jgi:hypothetical protein
MLKDLQLAKVVMGYVWPVLGERLGRDVDGTHLAAGTVAGEGSTGSSGGTKAEDLPEVGWFAEVDGWGYLQEIESGGI